MDSSEYSRSKILPNTQESAVVITIDTNDGIGRIAINHNVDDPMVATYAAIKPFTDLDKYRLWMQVELSLVDAWASAGVIPEKDAAYIIERDLEMDPEEIAEIELETHHDVAAFVKYVQNHLDARGRWFHYGVTSSDIVDTAFNLQLKQHTVDIKAALKSAGKLYGTHNPYRIWLHEAFDEVQWGQLSGPVGTHATVGHALEERVCQLLGLEPAKTSTQVIGRDRHAAWVGIMVRLLCSIAPEAALKHLAIGYWSAALEDVSLWHERDISHSSVERIIVPGIINIFNEVLELKSND